MKGETDNKPPLASFEADLFGLLFAFHQKTMILLRDSWLDDEKQKVVAERLKTLLEEMTAEMKTTKQLNWSERLDAAYDEAKRLVHELLHSQEDKKAKPKSRRKNKP